MSAMEFVESWFDAWNQQDPKGIADHLTRDGCYIDVPENAQSNHDELLHSLGEFFSRFDQRYELIGEVLHSANTVAFQYRILSCGRSKAVYAGAEFITLSGDAAMAITDYYEVPGGEPRIPAARARQLKKYAKSGLNPGQMRIYKERLEAVMRTQQAYLEPDLTLPRLASLVDCSVNHLSQVINAGLGMSFFEYLNQHRIRHAQTLLVKPGQQPNAILNIAFAAGFNSNSAFYCAFKKLTGKTPAQYRRAQLNKTH